MRHFLLTGLLAVGCGGTTEAAEASRQEPEIVTAVEIGNISAICWQERRAGMSMLEAVRARYVDCTESGDCLMANVSTGCDITCPAPVNRHGSRSLEKARLEVEHAYCNDYRARGCPPSIALCAPAVALCISSRCTTFLTLHLQEQ